MVAAIISILLSFGIDFNTLADSTATPLTAPAQTERVQSTTSTQQTDYDTGRNSHNVVNCDIDVL